MCSQAGRGVMHAAQRTAGDGRHPARVQTRLDRQAGRKDKVFPAAEESAQESLRDLNFDSLWRNPGRRPASDLRGQETVAATHLAPVAGVIRLRAVGCC